AAELDWFVAETDALRKARPDVGAAVRERLVADTRRWAMRNPRAPAVAGRLADAENWGESAWEAFTLQTLWALCRAGVAAVPSAVVSDRPPVRHRDWLVRAGADDPDLAAHDLLIRFTA